MAYTPVNWQTGDVITADKLNKMDRGWGYGGAELFSESVMTTESEGMYSATPGYRDTIDADVITVIFDGTEYTCPRIDAFNQYFYGGFSEQGAVFTEYPFTINSTGHNTNAVYTETGGTHTIAVMVPTLQTSADFAKAASAAIGGALYRLVLNVTTWRQVVDAIAAGKLVFRTWTEAYDGTTVPDTAYAGVSLVTDAYIDSHGEYRVSAITVNMGDHLIDDFHATTADEVLRKG